MKKRSKEQNRAISRRDTMLKSILDLAPEHHFKNKNFLWHRVELARRRARRSAAMYGYDHPITAMYRGLLGRRLIETRESYRPKLP